QVSNLFLIGYLGERYNEVFGKRLAGTFRERRQKKLERPKPPFSRFRRKRLDPKSAKRRDRFILKCRGKLAGCSNGVNVFFFVRPKSVTVFKIDPEILDRLLFELRYRLAINRPCIPRRELLFTRFRLASADLSIQFSNTVRISR